MTINPQKIKVKKAKQKPGSAKCIETMYRNAYRAELDLIALATTKSNIMISINGFIVSALMISGGFIDTDKPLLLIPAVLFLSASAASIYFALLAASPNSSSTHQKKEPLFSRIFNRNSSTHNGNISNNILIYEDRARISRPEYIQQMSELIETPEKVYAKMSDQLYWLGDIANSKFNKLKISYAILRWGILLSVVLFLVIKVSSFASFPSLESIVTGEKTEQFKGIYEASAVEQLSDGKLLVIEDESSRALNIVSMNKGEMKEDARIDRRLTQSFSRKLNDLEGSATDASGSIFLTTSFSHTSEGLRNQEREQLLRFKINNNKLQSASTYLDFGNLLRKSNIFDSLIPLNGGRAIDLNAINIEALSFDKNKRDLLFGFRAPLIHGKSMIVRIKNPNDLFDHQAKPILSNEISLLDLDGGGIRSLIYDKHLGGYLIANEIIDSSGKLHPQLWLWSGESHQQPKALNIPAIAKMTNIEAITQVIIDGVRKVLVLSDDGNRKSNQPAHYLILDYKQLS